MRVRGTREEESERREPIERIERERLRRERRERGEREGGPNCQSSCCNWIIRDALGASNNRNGARP